MDINRPGLSDAAFDLLKAFKTMAANAAYEKLTVSVNDLKVEGKKLNSLQWANWDKAIMEFKGSKEGIKLTKTSDGQIGISAEKKQETELSNTTDGSRAFAMKEVTQ